MNRNKVEVNRNKGEVNRNKGEDDSPIILKSLGTARVERHVVSCWSGSDKLLSLLPAWAQSVLRCELHSHICPHLGLSGEEV